MQKNDYSNADRAEGARLYSYLWQKGRRTKGDFFLQLEWLVEFPHRKLKLGNLKGLNAQDTCLGYWESSEEMVFFPHLRGSFGTYSSELKNPF